MCRALKRYQVSLNSAPRIIKEQGGEPCRQAGPISLATRPRVSVLSCSFSCTGATAKGLNLCSVWGCPSRILERAGVVLSRSGLENPTARVCWLVHSAFLSLEQCCLCQRAIGRPGKGWSALLCFTEHVHCSADDGRRLLKLLTADPVV